MKENKEEMDAKKLDAVFKRKLKTHKSTPSEDAWAKMEMLLDDKPKSNFWIWRVAASVLLLLVSGLVFWKWNNHHTETKDQLTLTALPSKPMEIADKPLYDIPNRLERVRISQPITDADQQGILEVASTEVYEMSEIITSEEDLVANNEPPKKKVKITHISKSAKKRNPIRITYKRGTSPETIAKKDTVKGINDVQPDQLWADLRDAKNRAIRNALNFKKNKVENSNTTAK